MNNEDAYIRWKLAETLFPRIKFIDDRELRKEMCTPRFIPTHNHIVIEPKDESIRRIGISYDLPDM